MSHVLDYSLYEVAISVPDPLWHGEKAIKSGLVGSGQVGSGRAGPGRAWSGLVNLNYLTTSTIIISIPYANPSPPSCQSFLSAPSVPLWVSTDRVSLSVTSHVPSTRIATLTVIMPISKVRIPYPAFSFCGTSGPYLGAPCLFGLT